MNQTNKKARNRKFQAISDLVGEDGFASRGLKKVHRTFFPAMPSPFSNLIPSHHKKTSPSAMLFGGRGWIREPRAKKGPPDLFPGKAVALFESHPLNPQKNIAFSDAFWWERMDSNHRSRRQQIYSLPPLATRELSLELVMGLEPATC